MVTGHILIFKFLSISFQQLVKTTPTSCVCLVFDSTGVTDFQGPQYRVPGSPPISLTGLNSYPIMISIPMVTN